MTDKPKPKLISRKNDKTHLTELNDTVQHDISRMLDFHDDYDPMAAYHKWHRAPVIEPITPDMPEIEPLDFELVVLDL